MKTMKKFSRKELDYVLQQMGYKKDSRKSLLIGRMTPNYIKAKKMYEDFGVPFTIWGKNIKFYLQNSMDKNA